jgi:hypothetical protein
MISASVPAGRAWLSPLGAPVAAICLITTAATLFYYPILPWLLATVLALYGAALWRYPFLWLIVVPVALAGVDLTPWTGWTFITESDLFVLVTAGVLAIRTPVAPRDLLPGGPARWLIVVVALSYAVSTLIAFHAHVGPANSDLVYMRPENAIRITKGFGVALILLPLLRDRQKTHGDAWPFFAAGMVAAMALVAIETFVERAVFPGAFDILSVYPAAGPFASMHVGGGHLGVFVALAMPFAFLRRDKRHRLERMALRALTVAATYAVIITFSPIIYGAAAVSAVLTFSGRTAPRGEGGSRRRLGDRTILRLIMRGIYVGALLVAVLFGLLGANLMMDGVHRVGATAYHRVQSLERRLSIRDDSLIADIFGMGLGTFPRATYSRATDARSNFGVYHDEDEPYLSLISGPQFFFGQKVPVRPGPPYTVELLARAQTLPTGVGVIMCEKYLLFSEHCSGQRFKLAKAGDWESLSVELKTDTMNPDAVFGPFHRPVEIALLSTEPNNPVDIKAVRLVAPDGQQLIINGDFRHGVERWYFTDEIHDYWQIMNQYVMTFFERGIVGLGAFIALIWGALLGARRTMRRGDRMGTAVVASLGTFLLLCLSESLLHAPRVATIFYLVCFVGLLMLEQGTNREYLNQMRRPWTPRRPPATVTDIASRRGA